MSSRLLCCMSLGLIARGYGLAASSARLSRATLLAVLADLVDTCVLGSVWGVVVGLGNYDCIWLAKFPPLLCIKIEIK